MNLKREPAIVTGTVVGLIMAFVTWLKTMGYLDWTPEQVTATETLVEYVVMFGTPVVGAIVTRYFVTPVSDPRDNNGNPLRP